VGLFRGFRPFFNKPTIPRKEKFVSHLKSLGKSSAEKRFIIHNRTDVEVRKKPLKLILRWSWTVGCEKANETSRLGTG
jgi:hypothetical protein